MLSINPAFASSSGKKKMQKSAGNLSLSSTEVKLIVKDALKDLNLKSVDSLVGTAVYVDFPGSEIQREIQLRLLGDNYFVITRLLDSKAPDTFVKELKEACAQLGTVEVTEDPVDDELTLQSLISIKDDSAGFKRKFSDCIADQIVILRRKLPSLLNLEKQEYQGVIAKSDGVPTEAVQSPLAAAAATIAPQPPLSMNISDIFAQIQRDIRDGVSGRQQIKPSKVAKAKRVGDHDRDTATAPHYAAAGIAADNAATATTIPLITESEFELLLAELNMLEENEEKLQVIEEYSQMDNFFTSNQLIKLLEITPSVQTRLAIIRLIGPQLVDPKAKVEYFLGLFRFAAEKSQVEEILKARNRELSSSLSVTKGKAGGGEWKGAMGGKAGHGTGGVAAGRGAAGRGGRGNVVPVIEPPRGIFGAPMTKKAVSPPVLSAAPPSGLMASKVGTKAAMPISKAALFNKGSAAPPTPLPTPPSKPLPSASSTIPITKATPTSASVAPPNLPTNSSSSMSRLGGGRAAMEIKEAELDGSTGGGGSSGGRKAPTSSLRTSNSSSSRQYMPFYSSVSASSRKQTIASPSSDDDKEEEVDKKKKKKDATATGINAAVASSATVTTTTQEVMNEFEQLMAELNTGEMKKKKTTVSPPILSSPSSPSSDLMMTKGGTRAVMPIARNAAVFGKVAAPPTPPPPPPLPPSRSSLYPSSPPASASTPISQTTTPSATSTSVPTAPSRDYLQHIGRQARDDDYHFGNFNDLGGRDGDRRWLAQGTNSNRTSSAGSFSKRPSLFESLRSRRAAAVTAAAEGDKDDDDNNEAVKKKKDAEKNSAKVVVKHKAAEPNNSQESRKEESIDQTMETFARKRSNKSYQSSKQPESSTTSSSKSKSKSIGSSFFSRLFSRRKEQPPSAQQQQSKETPQAQQHQQQVREVRQLKTKANTQEEEEEEEKAEVEDEVDYYRTLAEDTIDSGGEKGKKGDDVEAMFTTLKTTKTTAGQEDVDHDPDQDDHPPSYIRLYIQTRVGKAIPVTVLSEATVFDIKHIIYEKEGISPHQQKLLNVAGQGELEDDRTLLDYQIKHESKIELEIILRSGRGKADDDQQIVTSYSKEKSIGKVSLFSEQEEEDEQDYDDAFIATSSSMMMTKGTKKIESTVVAAAFGHPTYIRLYIQTPVGEMIPVTVLSDATIMDVKKVIYDKEGIPPSEQQLLKKEADDEGDDEDDDEEDDELKDDRKLIEYQIGHEAKIKLKFRMFAVGESSNIREKGRRIRRSKEGAATGKKITLYIISLTGKTIPITTTSSSTILQVKEEIYQREGIPPDQQRYFFAGKELDDDDRTWAEYQIGYEATIQFQLRLRGGGTLELLQAQVTVADSGRNRALLPVMVPAAADKEEEEDEEESWDADITISDDRLINEERRPKMMMRMGGSSPRSPPLLAPPAEVFIIQQGGGGRREREWEEEDEKEEEEEEVRPRRRGESPFRSDDGDENDLKAAAAVQEVEQQHEYAYDDPYDHLLVDDTAILTIDHDHQRLPTIPLKDEAVVRSSTLLVTRSLDQKEEPAKDEVIVPSPKGSKQRRSPRKFGQVTKMFDDKLEQLTLVKKSMTVEPAVVKDDQVADDDTDSILNDLMMLASALPTSSSTIYHPLQTLANAVPLPATMLHHDFTTFYQQYLVPYLTAASTAANAVSNQADSNNEADKVDAVIGKGGSGTVYRGIFEEEVVAFKVIPSDEMAAKEIHWLRRVDHPRILPLKNLIRCSPPPPVFTPSMASSAAAGANDDSQSSSQSFHSAQTTKESGGSSNNVSNSPSKNASLNNNGSSLVKASEPPSDQAVNPLPSIVSSNPIPSPSFTILIFPFMQKGDLFHRLYYANTAYHPSPLLAQARLQYLLDIIEAIAYLHRKHVIHRDIKLENILLDDQEEHVYLHDVGIAEEVVDLVSGKAVKWAGTLGYIDPQYMKTNLLTAEVDIFAFGVVILTLLTKLPAYFPSKNISLYSVVLEKARTDGTIESMIDKTAGFPSSLSDRLYELAMDCICVHEVKTTAKQLQESLQQMMKR